MKLPGEFAITLNLSICSTEVCEVVTDCSAIPISPVAAVSIIIIFKALDHEIAPAPVDLSVHPAISVGNVPLVMVASLVATVICAWLR